MWDAASGERLLELKGHARCINVLCVCGLRLASGSDDRTIKVWSSVRVGAGLEWPCERTLEGHNDVGVDALAVWGDKLIIGSGDDTIRVWDLSTGGLDATLTGHGGTILGLVVHQERLYSTFDWTIRVWDAGTWTEARSVAESDADEDFEKLFLRCLVTSGSKLISGSVNGRTRRVR